MRRAERVRPGPFLAKGKRLRPNIQTISVSGDPTEQAEPRRSVPQEKTPDFRSGVQAQFLKGQQTDHERSTLKTDRQ